MAPNERRVTVGWHTMATHYYIPRATLPQQLTKSTMQLFIAFTALLAATSASSIDCNVNVVPNACPTNFDSPFELKGGCYSTGTCMAACGGGQTCTDHICGVHSSGRPYNPLAAHGGCKTEGSCMGPCGGGEFWNPSSTTQRSLFAGNDGRPTRSLFAELAMG